MSMLLDALGYVGDALSAPGDYTRGLLVGRPGERATGRQLLTSLGLDPGEGLGGDVAGFAADVATDPLTYLGVGLGAKAGRAAGRAAEAAGPRFATTADDLGRLFAESGNSNAIRTGERMMGEKLAPAFERAASEVPPGSEFLGAGVEGVAVRTPGGRVVRIGIEEPGAPGRPVAEGVLQADRAVDIPAGEYHALRVEHMPLAEGVRDRAVWGTRDPSDMLTRMDRLDESLAQSGLRFEDRHLGNVGVVGGRSAVIDPGSLDLSKFAGAYQKPVTAAEPSRLMRILMGLGGGDDAVRDAIAAGRSGPNFVPGFALTGGGLGANLGAWGRV